MRPVILLVLTASWVTAASADSSVLSWRQRGNTTLLQISGGTAEVEFLSSSTFRFQRCRTGRNCPSRPGTQEKVPVVMTELSGAIEWKTEYLRVAVNRSNSALEVRKARGGEELLRESPGGTGLFEWQLDPAERIYGLGVRNGPEWNRRGSIEMSPTPLLISSRGYGLYLALPGVYQFDLRGPARISGGFVRDRVEFFFYYGPSPKEVLTEHRIVKGAMTGIEETDTGIQVKAPAYATPMEGGPLTVVLERLAHASYSGILAPALTLTGQLAPVAAWLPLLTHPDPDRADPNVALLRFRYAPYVLTYLWEARDRGTPAFRPLAMQYPEDAEAARHPDEFMLGDEILIAAGERAYLPRGIWTDLRTNQTFRGRQTVDARGTGTAVYARNGSIVPLMAGSAVQLHYFPRLAAEFFIAEPAADAYTKAHAGPAGEYLRLEVEPVTERQFEWIVHHVSRPESVTASGVKLAPDAWRYDAASGNLHVRVKAAADDDAIVNIILEKRLE